MKISTIAVHGGLTDTSHYAAAFPVYLTSTFIQKGPTEFREYGYSRTANPTRSDVEKHAADIEGAKHGIATATGMAAVSLVFETLNAGDRVLISNNVYGGTWLYATELFKKRDVEFTVVDDFNTYDFETAPADVKLVYIETPSNPLLEVTDIAHVAKAAKARNWLLAVDNTFLTGVNQRPLDLGADVVIYSATKYYGGHSDLLAGLVVLNDDKLYEKLKLYSKALGGVLDPFDCFLLERGIKTLPLRLARHEENTHAIARYLSAHPGVEAVFYPGLESDPGYAVNRRQSKGAGGVLSFRFNEEAYDLEKFVKALKLFQFAVSLGSVESLISIPATMTHESYAPELQKKLGITPNLIRVAVGIEDIEDLIADFEQAFAAAKR